MAVEKKKIELVRFECEGQMAQPVTFQVYFGRGSPFKNAFYKLFTRWICGKTTNRFGKVPSGLSSLESAGQHGQRLSSPAYDVHGLLRCILCVCFIQSSKIPLKFVHVAVKFQQSTYFLPQSRRLSTQIAGDGVGTGSQLQLRLPPSSHFHKHPEHVSPTPIGFYLFIYLSTYLSIYLSVYLWVRPGLPGYHSDVMWASRAERERRALKMKMKGGRRL